MIEFNTEIVEIRNGSFIRLTVDPKEMQEQEFLSVALEKWGRVGVRLSKPFTDKTLQQHRAVEAMIDEWYRSGVHSAPDGLSLPLFRYWVKCEYGALVGYHEEIGKVPKSLKDYTKQEMTDFIDNIKSDILQSMQPLTWKMQEILRGMS